MLQLKYKILFVFIITLIGGFIRFYEITSFPIHLNHDEISQLYDAISIAQTGKDIYGNFLPTIFKSIQDYKPPFYTYATVLTYYLTGFNEITIKIPGALFGTLAIPAVFWFVYQLFKNFNIAILSCLLSALSIFEIHYSRKGFESSAGIFFMFLGFASILRYFDNREKSKYILLSLIFFAISMYTYFSHATILPLLLITFFIIYKSKVQFKLSYYLKPLIIFLVLILPLISIIIFNPDSRRRSQAVFITQDTNLQKQINTFTKDNGWDYNLAKYKTVFDYSFNRYLSQFEPSNIFGKGLGFTNQGPLDIGLLYLFFLPFLFLGIYYLINLENFSREKFFIFWWIAIGMIPSGITFEQNSAHRVLMVYTMFNIISAIGVYYFCLKINDLVRIKKLRMFIFSFLIGLFILNCSYFILMYTVIYPNEKSDTLHYPFKQVSEFAWKNYDNFSQIVIDPKFGMNTPSIGAGAHYYLAFYGKYPPAKMQQEFHLGSRPREVLFDKFSIREVDWIKDSKLKNTLVIASPWSLPETIKKEQPTSVEFKFINGHVAFYAISL